VNDKPVIIMGAGGHAKVVAEVLKLMGRSVLGVTTPDLVSGTEIIGTKVLGDDSIVFEYEKDEVELVNGIGSLPKQKLRWKLASVMRDKGYHFATVIHPSAIISSDVILDEGVQIMAGVVIQPGTTIGKDTIINTGVLVDHDCSISHNCHLAPSVVLSGGATVNSDVHLGTGSRVIQGISIGHGVIVAAGTTVYKNISSDMLVKQQLSTIVEEVMYA